MKRVTQQDIARIAGVSRATVSNVLNGRVDGVPVSVGTRRRILEAVAEFGYVPDARAQSLRSGSSRTIAFAIPDCRNPHYWEYIEGVEEEIERAEYYLFLLAMNPADQADPPSLKAIADWRIDGLIVFDPFDPASVAGPRPVIVQVTPSQPPAPERPGRILDFVFADYYTATLEALRHLFDLGHQRIAFLNGVAVPALANDRLRAYQDGMAASAAAKTETRIVHCGAALEDGYQAALELLGRRPRPTAVMAVNDLLAIGVVRAATDLGLTVPGDLSVVGFDDIPLARYVTPSLTTVSKDTREAGRASARLLLARLRDPDRPAQVFGAKPKLVIRESTGPVPREGLAA